MCFERSDQMNCLITGASLGIGHNLAYKFASLGYNLFLTYYTNKNLCIKLQKELESKYQIKCYIEKCDLKKEEDIKNVIDSFQKKLGKLNILVNNADTYADEILDNKTKESFMETLEVNVVGTFLMIKYSSKIMDNGMIINMSSTDGIDTYNEYNLDYAISKAAIIQMTKSMSLIFKGIKTIAIAPNWVKTESTMSVDKSFLDSELKRIGQKELIEIDTVVDKIIDAINNPNIKSGEVIRIETNERIN